MNNEREPELNNVARIGEGFIGLLLMGTGSEIGKLLGLVFLFDAVFLKGGYAAAALNSLITRNPNRH